MYQVELSRFGGVAGGVLGKAFGWRAMANGLMVCLCLFFVGFFFGMFQAPRIASVFTQAIIGFALARAALNGVHGEYRGTLLSSAGGVWTTVVTVAARYTLLTVLWQLPLMMMGLSTDPQTIQGLATGVGLGNMFGLFMAYVVLSTVTPPLFLCISVAAGGFVEIFHPETWKRTFGGRLPDLLTIYAVYSGAVALLLVVGVPITLGLFAVAWPLGLLFGLASLVFFVGVSLDLLGRLCGFFAFGHDPLSPAGSGAPIGGPTDAGSSGVAGAPSDAAPAFGAATAMAEGEGVPLAAQAGPTAEGDAAGGPALPILREPQAHVDEARRRFKVDPAGAIAELEELQATHAPCGPLLQAIALLHLENGNVDGALESAKHAFPVCFAAGQSFVAADLYCALWPHRERLDLGAEPTAKIAGILARRNELTRAANAFAAVMRDDPTHARAIKGLLQIAETLLRKRQQPAEALRLYDYLAQHAGDSPLGEFIREGRDEAARKARASKAS